MNNWVRRFLSRKRNVVVLVILILCFGWIISSAINNIYSNAAKMASAPDVAYFPPYPKITKQAKIAKEVLTRGEYLVKAGDCIACHTNTLEKGQAFAGGLPMQTPFGVIYSPNITPDKKTGIGNWTDEQFITAMQKGISPKGHYYYPAFPFYYFANVSKDDLKAIKAYLDNIPAVSQTNRRNTMIFPFNLRILQLPWRILFFHPNKENVLQNNKTNLLKRGDYLVNGLGHCAMCHTPSYHIISDQLPLAAPIHKYNFTGAKVGGYLAPDISSNNLGKIAVDEIVAVFKENKLIGGGKVVGPMLEVNQNSLSNLTDDDLTAIATYLKSVKSERPPKPRGQSVGKGTYEMYCSGCHAMGAGGAPRFGDQANWAEVMKKGMPQVYTNALKGVGGMPAKGTCLSCSDDDIKQAVDYMVQSGAKGGHTYKIMPVPKLTFADGQKIYEKNCSVCHSAKNQTAPQLGRDADWTAILPQGFLTIYLNVVHGNKGHLPNGGCPACNDAELKAAIKYLLKESNKNDDYSLW